VSLFKLVDADMNTYRHLTTDITPEEP